MEVRNTRGPADGPLSKDEAWEHVIFAQLELKDELNRAYDINPALKQQLLTKVEQAIVRMRIFDQIAPWQERSSTSPSEVPQPPKDWDSIRELHAQLEIERTRCNNLHQVLQLLLMQMQSQYHPILLHPVKQSAPESQCKPQPDAQPALVRELEEVQQKISALLVQHDKSTCEIMQLPRPASKPSVSSQSDSQKRAEPINALERVVPRSTEADPCSTKTRSDLQSNSRLEEEAFSSLGKKYNVDVSQLSLSQKEKLVFDLMHESLQASAHEDVKPEDLLRESRDSQACPRPHCELPGVFQHLRAIQNPSPRPPSSPKPRSPGKEPRPVFKQSSSFHSKAQITGNEVVVQIQGKGDSELRELTRSCKESVSDLAPEKPTEDKPVQPAESPSKVEGTLRTKEPTTSAVLSDQKGTASEGSSAGSGRQSDPQGLTSNAEGLLGQAASNYPPFPRAQTHHNFTTQQSASTTSKLERYQKQLRANPQKSFETIAKSEHEYPNSIPHSNKSNLYYEDQTNKQTLAHKNLKEYKAGESGFKTRRNALGTLEVKTKPRSQSVYKTHESRGHSHCNPQRQEAEPTLSPDFNEYVLPGNYRRFTVYSRAELQRPQVATIEATTHTDPKHGHTNSPLSRNHIRHNQSLFPQNSAYGLPPDSDFSEASDGHPARAPYGQLRLIARRNHRVARNCAPNKKLHSKHRLHSDLLPLEGPGSALHSQLDNIAPPNENFSTRLASADSPDSVKPEAAATAKTESVRPTPSPERVLPTHDLDQGSQPTRQYLHRRLVPTRNESLFKGQDAQETSEYHHAPIARTQFRNAPHLIRFNTDT